MKFNLRKFLLGAAAIIPMVGLAACDADAVLQNIKANCAGAVAGTTVVISIVSSLVPGAQPVAVLSNTIGSDATAICDGLTAAAQGVIGAITSAGGTATATMTETNPQSGRKTARRAIFRPDGVVVYVGTVKPGL